MPVRRHQTETVPAVRTLGVKVAVPFKDKMLDPVTFQVPADRQAGMSGPDDDDRHMGNVVVGHGIIPGTGR